MADDPQQTTQEDSHRFRALFEMATDGIITITDRGHIESVNRAACELFGYEAEELVGRKINILMNQYDRDRHDGYIDRYHHTGQPHIIGIGREVIGRRKDGSEFPLRLAVSEVQLRDRTIYTGILHDLTDIHHAQSRIEQLNADLERKVASRTADLIEREKELQRALGKEKELNELKSRFLSMASHEFKTPLSTILSSVELIDLYKQPNQAGKRSHHVEKIKEAIDQLTEVLDDFLSLSKLEQGKVSASLRTVDLPAVIATSIEMCEGQFREGQIVELDLADVPRRIESDPKMLRQILINLLSNAAKYSSEHSRILVKTAARPHHVCISVTDRGIGIPAEDQAHLFDRFFRAHNVENITGTGLGLNIVWHYVKLLGGRIEFTSELDEGSTFTVLLPRQKLLAS